MIKLNVPTYGKTDSIKLNPADLLETLPEFTGRADRTEEQIQAKVVSLLAVGQIHPVLYRVNDERKPVLITGVTRAIAADRITKQGLTDANGVTYGPENPFTLKAECKSAAGNRPLSPLEALLLTFQENNGDNSSPMVLADEIAFVNILSAEPHNLTVQQISDKLHKDLAWVGNRLKVNALDPTTMKQLIDGEIKLDTAVTLTKLTDPKQRAAAVAGALAAEGKVTAAGVAEAARNLGATLDRPVKRSDKQVNDWMKSKLTAENPESAVKAFLFAFYDFKKGVQTTEDLDAAYNALLALVPVEVIVQTVAA